MYRLVLFLAFLLFIADVSAQDSTERRGIFRKRKKNTEQQETPPPAIPPPAQTPENNEPQPQEEEQIITAPVEEPSAPDTTRRRKRVRNEDEGETSEMNTVRGDTIPDTSKVVYDYSNNNFGFPFKPHSPTLYDKKAPTLEIQRLRNKEYNFWLVWVILGVLAVIAFLKYNFEKNINEFFRGVYSINIAQQLQREHENTNSLLLILLNLNFIVAGGLYLYILSNYFKWNLPLDGYPLLLFFIVGLGLWYLLKYLFLMLLSKIFPFKETVKFYIFNVNIINKIIGILIIPFFIMLAYAPDYMKPWIFYISIAVIGSLLIYRYIRGVMIAKNYVTLHKFHFFIYLCTLEIAPTVILIKSIIIWAGI